jgi:hypothetical protein
VVTAKPAGSGVPARYFLPASRWTGPDLNAGRALRSQQLRELEGSAAYFACDPDQSLAGDVALLQTVEQSSGLLVGTQKVRLLPSVGAAADRFAADTEAVPDCQRRIRAQARAEADLSPGETAPKPDATVTSDAAGALDDATGGVRVYRTVTDYGTGAGSSTIEWVAMVREGAALSSISLPQLERSSISFRTLQRLAAQARAQLRWAAGTG